MWSAIRDYILWLLHVRKTGKRRISLFVLCRLTSNLHMLPCKRHISIILLAYLIYYYIIVYWGCCGCRKRGWYIVFLKVLVMWKEVCGIKGIGWRFFLFLRRGLWYNFWDINFELAFLKSFYYKDFELEILRGKGDGQGSIDHRMERRQFLIVGIWGIERNNCISVGGSS